MKNVYFISGIDTDCGKTYITGHLAKKLLDSGKKVITYKLIQTGCHEISEDILEHRKIMGIDVLTEDKNGETCPYVLSFPASPHLAFEIDRVDFEVRKIKQSLRKLADKYETVLCEGVGGLMVPLTKNYLAINFLSENMLPLILVTSSKLGSINHTLLSLQACKHYKLDLRYVIYNQFPDDDEIIAADSLNYLKDYLAANLPKVQLIAPNEFTKIIA